jgi:hypothetical protein
MNNFNSLPNIRSVGLAKASIQTLKIRLGMAIASTIFSLIELISKTLYKNFVLINGFISFVSFFVDIVTLIIFFVWLYRIHVDLQNLFDDYSITPVGSIARFLIPFYHIWGIANTFNTFANKFEPEGGDLSQFGKTVRLLIIPFYCCIFGSNEISHFTVPEFIANPENPSLPMMFFISAILDVGWSFVLLSITKAMQSAVNQKAKRAVG